MTNTHGFVTLCLGPLERYSNYATVLAMSINIKKYRPHLICDEQQLAFFKRTNRYHLFDGHTIMPSDWYVLNGKADYGRAKLCIYKLLPYDLNLYIDADSFVAGGCNVEEMFAAFRDTTFTVSANPEMCFYYDNKVAAQWMSPKIGISLERIPFLMPTFMASSVMVFRKGEHIDFHEKALAWFYWLKTKDSWKDYGWFPGMIPDELCYMLAYGSTKMPLPNIFGYNKTMGSEAELKRLEDIEKGIVTFSTGKNSLTGKPKHYYNRAAAELESHFKLGQVLGWVDKGSLLI